MNCTKFEELSMLYFDGGANDQQINALKEHVNICSSCKEAFESMKSMIDLLELPEEVHIDEKFTADIMEKVCAFEESKLRTSKLLEKIALPVSVSFLILGAFLWIFILNNVNIGLLLYRGINLAKVIIDVIITTILSFNIIGYINFANEQLQLLMPISLVFVGIIISVENNKGRNHSNV